MRYALTLWLTSGEAWLAAGVLCRQAEGFLWQSERGGGWGRLRTEHGAMDAQATNGPAASAQHRYCQGLHLSVELLQLLLLFP